MTALIRLTTPDDAPAIQAIYAPFVRETTVSFEVVIPTIGEMAGRIEKVLTHFPWLVCERSDGFIAGYVYASKHRERAAYQWGVDVTVYVHPEARRGGVGRGLYTALFALLRLQGLYNAYAGIALPNPASVALHELLGFTPIGIYQQTGYKFGKWHDVGWWELTLQPRSDHPNEPHALGEIRNHADWQHSLQSGVSLIRL